MKKLGTAVAMAATIASGSSQAANWLMLQSTEDPGSAPRAKVWGFIQPEYQYTKGTELRAGPWKGQDAVFNLIGPDLDSSNTFQLRRARIGVRGTGFGLDSGVNYFILAEMGNNGITQFGGGGAVKLTDASVTLNYIPHARIRVGQFKYPGAEEGLQAIHVFNYVNFRCPPWRAKRRRVVPGSREATRDTRRAEGAKGDPKGASERGVQSYGRPVCSRNELAMLWRNAG